MKHLLFYFILTVSFGAYSQEQTKKQSKKYATVIMRVNYQANEIIYDDKGLSKSPVLTMEKQSVILTDARGSGYSDDKGRFRNVGLLISYMSTFGWTLTSSNVIPYEGGSGNQSTSVIINTNEYLQILIFEMPFDLPTTTN